MLNLAKNTYEEEFENRSFTPEEMLEIAACKRLTRVGFVNCQLSDEDVRHISTLPQVVNMSIEGCSITDNALQYIAQMPKLVYLFIQDNPITGSGFSHFAGNNKIDCIWLDNTLLSDENLSFFLEMKKLSVLRVNNTKVTFDGLMLLAPARGLRIIGENMFIPEQKEVFEQKQRELAKKNTTSNPKDIQEATQVLLDFFKAYTQWEKEATASDDSFGKEMQNRYIELVQPFYTEKKKKDGSARSFSGNDPYYTFNGCKITDNEQLTKNKVYLYFKNQLNSQFRMLLIRTDGTWKIESGQTQYGKWDKKYF